MTDPRVLSGLDQEFIQLLRFHSAQGKSRTTKSHGIGIAEVKELYRAVYRPHGEEHYEPKALLRCLNRLKAHGSVAWTGRDDGERVALPLTVKVYRQPETGEESLPLPPLWWRG